MKRFDDGRHSLREIERDIQEGRNREEVVVNTKRKRGGERRYE
jgi:hypothetical protein